MNVQDLRKAYSAQGIKGFSSANRAAFNANIEESWVLAIIEDQYRTRQAAAENAERDYQNQDMTEVEAHKAEVVKAAKNGTCEDCGRKVGDSGHPTLCPPCFDYAGWENTHNDNAHEGNSAASEQAEIAECPVCHPELDLRTAKKAGRSRAGMVIVAKGTEVHKSNTFKEAAEAAGWTVTILGSVTTDEDGEEIERFVAVAKRGEDNIELAWNGRAYDYPGSSASLKGKGRKVRNLKEALRLL